MSADHAERDRDRDGFRFPGDRQREGCPRGFVAHDVPGCYLQVPLGQVALPEPRHPRHGCVPHGPAGGVVSVQNRPAPGFQSCDDLRLCSGGPLNPAELTHVGAPDVQHHPNVEANQRGEPLDVPGPPGTHLADEELRRPVDPACRKRHPDLVVLASHRGHGGSPRLEHLCQEILGGGFPGGPRDAKTHHSPGAFLPDQPPRQPRESLHGVLNQDVGNLGLGDETTEHSCCPCGHGLRSEGVTIDPGTGNGDEKTAGGGLTIVEHHVGTDHGVIAHHLDGRWLHQLHQLAEPPRPHRPLPSIRRQVSRATKASSKATIRSPIC